MAARAGSDVAYGGPGDDALHGGRGADDLDDGGGGDRDEVFGGPGDDFAMLIDGDADDAVACGGGATDTAWVDLGDEIDHPSCEEVTIPVTAVGVLESPELTGYMYGDYALTDERSGRRLALRADPDDPPAEYLSGFVGERVLVYGTAVPGTEDGQVDFGPPRGGHRLLPDAVAAKPTRPRLVAPHSHMAPRIRPPRRPLRARIAGVGL